MGNAIGMNRLSIDLFYIRAYSSEFKKCRKYFHFRILNLNKFMFIILKLCYMIVKVIQFKYFVYVYPTVAISP
jgi:hypothetical protein